jgi:uncharacterized protein (UPF0147 family)
MTPQEQYDSRLPPEDPPEDIEEAIHHNEDVAEDPEVPWRVRLQALRHLTELYAMR